MSGATTPPGTVAFDPALFYGRFPEFGAVPPSLVSALFGEAGLYLDNTGASPIQDATPGGTRALILNLVTAHLVSLNAAIGGQPASPLVGRISSASEGSVSVSADLTGLPGSAAWWAQSRYGLAAWQALAPYRTAMYVPGAGARGGRLARGYGGLGGLGGFGFRVGYAPA